MSLFNLKKIFTKPFQTRQVLFLRLILVLIISLILTAPPAQAVSDFYSSSEIQFYDDCAAASSAGAGGGVISTSGETTGPPKAVQKIVWNTLVGGGIDEMHAAAVMGNIAHEGVWNPMSTELAANIPGDESKDPSVVGSYGYGLIGWTPGTRLLDSMREAGIKGKPWAAETQAVVILAHIKGKTPSQYPPSVGHYFLNTKNIEDATTAYQGTDAHKGFENPADKTGSLPERIRSAKKFLREFGGSTASGSGGSSAPTLAAGNIPVSGKDVGASEFTDAQGYKGDNLTNTYSYAELSPSDTGKVTEHSATAMGGLKYKQRLAITYNGKTVIAEKLDIGLGGGDVGGKKRAIDLHFDKTATALGISKPNTWTGVVRVQAVPNNTKLGPADPSSYSSSPTPAPPSSGPCGCSSSSVGGSSGAPLTGKTNAEKAFNYLVGKGLTGAQAAGIVGNLMVESGGLTEKLDTHAHNDISGTHDGIAQWDTSRWASLKEYVNGDPYDLANQLDFLWHELKTTESGALEAIKAADSAMDAALAFQNEFERCGDASACAESKRTASAQKIFEKYGGGSTSSSSSSGECTSGPINTNCSATKPVYGSVNGSGDEYSVQQLTRIFGDPGTASDHSEMDKNLTKVDFLGNSVEVNKKVAPCLKGVSDKLSSENVSYDIRAMGCYRFDSNNGSSNIGLKSYHTYGAACDINPDTNPFVSGGAAADHDMPKAYIEAFRDYGFTWGGDWVSVKDYMHFEFNGIKP